MNQAEFRLLKQERKKYQSCIYGFIVKRNFIRQDQRNENRIRSVQKFCGERHKSETCANSGERHKSETCAKSVGQEDLRQQWTCTKSVGQEDLRQQGKFCGKRISL